MSESKKFGPRIQGPQLVRAGQPPARVAAAAAKKSKPPAPIRNARPAPSALVQPKRPPAAPPVYRPQPAPKVLQKKTPPGRPAGSAPACASPTAQTRKPPVAPPAYRPEPKKVVQPKAAIAPARTSEAALQMKPQPAAAGKRAVTPPTRPAPQASAPTRPALPIPTRPALRSSVVQRMIDDEEMEERYGSDYWPPPKTPLDAPPTPTYNYYKIASDYQTQQGKMNSADAYMDFYEENSGKSIGMSTGTGEEDDFDESYVDIPDTLRPSAPSAKLLWNNIYSPLLPSTTNHSLVKIMCEEKCNKWLYMDKKTKKEYNKTKRPPMCHIIPFNYIRWAAEWVYANSTSPTLTKPYKGPNPKNYPADTWKNLVWDLSNLRPGHSSCNSQTASQAKGVPSLSDQKTAISYVVKKLKALEPTWF